MPFTGRVGTVNSMPSNVVPMFGAGGVRRAQSLSAQLSWTGSIATLHTYVFNQTSITVYKAVSRVRSFLTVLRTST